jgi:hypothetical protein
MWSLAHVFESYCSLTYTASNYGKGNRKNGEQIFRRFFLHRIGILCKKHKRRFCPIATVNVMGTTRKSHSVEVFYSRTYESEELDSEILHSRDWMRPSYTSELEVCRRIWYDRCKSFNCDCTMVHCPLMRCNLDQLPGGQTKRRVIGVS